VATVFGHAVHANLADYRAGVAVAPAAAALATTACLTGLRRGTAATALSQESEASDLLAA
jgi:hypothetical protein